MITGKHAGMPIPLFYYWSEHCYAQGTMASASLGDTSRIDSV